MICTTFHSHKLQVKCKDTVITGNKTQKWPGLSRRRHAEQGRTAGLGALAFLSARFGLVGGGIKGRAGWIEKQNMVVTCWPFGRKKKHSE